MSTPSIGSTQVQQSEVMTTLQEIASNPTVQKLGKRALDCLAQHLEEASYSSGPARPSEGGRDTVAQQPVGYSDIPFVVQDRLATDREYQDAKKLLELVLQLEDGQGLYFIDQQFGGLLGEGLGDGLISMADIKAAAADPAAPGHEAAKMLLRNPRLVSLLDPDGNGCISAESLRALADELKAQVYGKEADVEAQILAERGAPAGSAGGAAVGEAGEAGALEAEAAVDETGREAEASGAATPRPAPSTKPGVEGASENLANAADWLQQEMLRLANEAAAHPEKATALNQQIAMMQAQLQAIMNLMNQLTTLMSNLSKLWSDIAMNSIRNLK